MANETIQQLVRSRLDELGLGLREAARAYDPILTAADISDLQHGKRVNITRRKQQALALALKVPVERVEAAVATSQASKPLELPGRLNRLTPPSRRALVQIGDALLRLEDEHGVSPAEAAADTPARTETEPSPRRRRR